MIDDETLYAYLDGELSAEEARRVAAEVAADPALSARLEAQRRLRARLSAAFDPVASAAVPAGIAALPGSSNVSGIGGARAASAQRQGFGLRRWAAVAAALVAGLFGGHMLTSPEAPMALQDNRLVASPAIANTLDTRLASAGSQAPVQVHLTFRDAGGNICRSFNAPYVSGVACRENEAWAVRALFAREARADSTYRMAGTANAATMAYVEAIIVGDPFDAEAERRARQSGWAQR
ncbi:anti-sigma factor family protein [Sphingosinicella soli]|uniref:Anti-sigma factor RsiW n=1 Tax=Sphingosinicella soli TaxID=333708 RepID=A0A7W7F7W8_9SPHN|nr:anti-sigma factor [Sphingosinicella soli]MBB4633891.1 anti-sigma factor RsiW [Sphingosinicella soli]